VINSRTNVLLSEDVCRFLSPSRETFKGIYIFVLQLNLQKLTVFENDIILFKQIKKGQAKAMAKLYEKYYEPLCNFTFLFLKDPKLTEEIVDDVFIHIWRKRRELTIRTNLKAYLYRSARNGVLSHLRKIQPGFNSFDSIENHESHASVPTPETLLIREEIADKVNLLLDKLPAQAGLVFRMHKMDGLKYKEIAEALDISVKTVENHMGRALKIFRLLYEENISFFDES
jgi:RNA polymerase sigma-70 factor (ECF subfamily)